LPQSFFDYISSILNAPLQPLLTLSNNLLSAQINLELFSELWAIMIYVISMFYALLILYAGFSFIISGYDVQKRENSKEWLKNIIIMIILIQASFFIYELGVQLSSVMTSTTLSQIDQNFFLLSIDNLPNVALQIIYFLLYIFTLILTSLILIIRYGIVAIGVVLFPLSIFLYFILPLRPYGLLILNFLGVSLFITFLDAIILLGFSKILEIGTFANIKILLMISAFGLVDCLMFFLMFFSIIKSAFNLGMKGASIATKIAAAVA
jgi:hypothetical protein